MPSHAGDRILSYGDVLLRRQDLQLLSGPFWLNDQIVTFYFEYLWKEQLRSSDKIAFVGGALSYLLSQLAEAGDISGIVEPLQVTWLDRHAAFRTLMVYSSTSKEFCHYDSSYGSQNITAAQQIAEAVTPFLGKPTGHAVVKSVKSPQQSNGDDCGLYVLACARAIARAWQQSLPNTESLTEMLQSQITPQFITAFRKDLLQIIEALAGVV